MGLRRVVRAFTLVEMLLSLTITSLLAVSVVSTTRALTDVRKGVDRRIDRLTEARHAMNAIVSELRNVRRDPTSDQPVIIGHSGAPDMGNDDIELLVISDRRVRPDGAECDQYEVGFRLARPADRPCTVLLCRKDHALDDHTDEGGVATVIAEGIVALWFEYYTGSEWEPEWSDLKPQPPLAVRVTLTAANIDAVESITPADTVTLSTVVAIRVGRPGPESPGGPQQ